MNTALAHAIQLEAFHQMALGNVDDEVAARWQDRSYWFRCMQRANCTICDEPIFIGDYPGALAESYYPQRKA